MAIQRTSLNVSLTPELERFIAARVASGRYQTASEVARAPSRLPGPRQAREGGPGPRRGVGGGRGRAGGGGPGGGRGAPQRRATWGAPRWINRRGTAASSPAAA